MIAYLKGEILQKKPNYLILVNNNIGYEIFISLQTFQKLKNDNEEEELFIYTIHKEDSFQLYGFKTEEEKKLFKILLSITGIGPKMALMILSKIDVETFKKAVSEQNIDLLTSIGGIGKKRAEKLLFELKKKFKDQYGMEISEGAPVSGIQEDAVLALVNLGYSKSEAVNIIRKIPLSKDTTLEELIKKAFSS